VLDVLRVLLSAGEIPFKLTLQVGIDVLRSRSHHDDHARFFATMLNHATITMKSGIFEEMLKDQIACDKIDEAFENVESQIDNFFFSDNPQLHGLLGMLAFACWQREMLTQEEDSPADKAIDVDDIIEELPDRRTKKVAEYSQRAIDHLRIAIDSPNEIILQPLVYLLENSSNFTEAKNTLEGFRDSNAENPIAHRMLFEFLRRVDPLGSEWKKPARAYLLLDPRSAPNIALLPYIDHLQEKFIPDNLSNHERRQIFEDIVEILVWRVEHGDSERYTINNLVSTLTAWREFDDDTYNEKWLDRIKDITRCKHLPLQGLDCLI